MCESYSTSARVCVAFAEPNTETISAASLILLGILISSVYHVKCVPLKEHLSYSLRYVTVHVPRACFSR